MRNTRMADGRFSHRGVTLLELLISASVLSIILGAVLLLQLQGLRIYQDVAASDWASFEAATAVGRLEEDIQQCFRVIGRYPNRVTLSMPELRWDSVHQMYVPTQPLGHGDAIRYYLSDDTGQLGASGTHLWHAVREAGSPNFVRDPKPMADNVQALEFTYTMAAAPRDKSVRKVSLLIRAASREGGTTRTRTHTAEIPLRNVSYGPVTMESGADQ